MMNSIVNPGWRYRWLSRLLSPIFIGHATWNSFVRADMRFLKERLGFVSRSKQSAQWWHAASVGEIQTVWPLLQAQLIQSINKNVDTTWLVTTNTATGFHVLTQRLEAAKLDKQVHHAYLPIDTPSITKRFIQRLKPQRVVVVETEIWPNLYTELHAKNIPVSIVNARATQKTLKSIQVGQRLASTLIPAYQAALNPTKILARSDSDAVAYQTLGANPNRIYTVGDLKFADNRPSRCKTPLPIDSLSAPYVVAASTHPPEEERLANQWMAQTDVGLLVIVPRHVNRAQALHDALSNQFGDAVAPRRSTGAVPTRNHRLYLADTIGELHDWYSGAAAAFVGGSLIPRGGHNVLEPYFHHIPVITGPHTENFEDAVQWLRNKNAIEQVDDETHAIQALIVYRNNPDSNSPSHKNGIKTNQHSDLLAEYATHLKAGDGV